LSLPLFTVFFKMNKTRLINIFLLLFSIFLPIYIADLVLKNLRLPKDSSRLMLLAGSSLFSDLNGFRRYEPNKNVEQLAIYDKNIAYRYTYKTNNKGLVSHPDLQKNDVIDLTINGDSFSEGQGGYPWVVEWQKNELKELQITSLNYSIAGNGFEDFLKGSIHSKKYYNASRNIIFFIEHNAYRPYQRMAKNRSCSFYSNGSLDNILGPLTCKTYGVVWHHIDSKISDKEILDKAKYLQQYGVLASINKFLKEVKNSFTRKITLKSDLENEIKSQKIELSFGEIPSYTKIAISKINSIYGKNNVLYVQLPQTVGKPNKSALEFTKRLAALADNKIINLWESCPLERSDFHVLDNHPNVEGYKKIKRCITENKDINNFIKS